MGVVISHVLPAHPENGSVMLQPKSILLVERN
jgi:hypothetical protein